MGSENRSLRSMEDMSTHKFANQPLAGFFNSANGYWIKTCTRSCIGFHVMPLPWYLVAERRSYEASPMVITGITSGARKSD